MKAAEHRRAAENRLTAAAKGGKGTTDMLLTALVHSVLSLRDDDATVTPIHAPRAVS